MNALREFRNEWGIQAASCVLGLVTCFIVSIISLGFGSKGIAAVALIGGASPIVFSLLNCFVIRYMYDTRGLIGVYLYNLSGIITKSIFMLSLTYIGVRLLELPVGLYTSVLCSVWFSFHMAEGFYTQTLIQKTIDENVKSFEVGELVAEAMA